MRSRCSASPTRVPSLRRTPTWQAFAAPDPPESPAYAEGGGALKECRADRRTIAAMGSPRFCPAGAGPKFYPNHMTLVLGISRCRERPQRALQACLRASPEAKSIGVKVVGGSAVTSKGAARKARELDAPQRRARYRLAPRHALPIVRSANPPPRQSGALHRRGRFAGGSAKPFRKPAISHSVLAHARQNLSMSSRAASTDAPCQEIVTLSRRSARHPLGIRLENLRYHKIISGRTADLTAPLSRTLLLTFF